MVTRIISLVREVGYCSAWAAGDGAHAAKGRPLRSQGPKAGMGSRIGRSEQRDGNGKGRPS